MKTLITVVAVSALIAGAAAAAPNDHHGWGQDYGAAGHQWHKGDHIGQNDWNGGAQVDWRSHHLRQPPRGYEWRQVGGQYVLAAVATGVIASIILGAGH